MENIYIHPHALKHGLAERDICYAWENFVRKQHRKSPEEDKVLTVGYDTFGRLIQMVGRDTELGVLVYHAMTPPTKNVLRELGLTR